MKLWLDDKRPMPSDFDIHVYTAQEAIGILKTETITHISFDHDLGPEQVTGSGYTVAVWFERVARKRTYPRVTWKIHSQNPVGRQRIQAAMQAADRFWTEWKEEIHE